MSWYLHQTRVICIAASIVSWLPNSSGAADITVELRPESVVEAPFFLLGQIAEISADDTNVAEDLRALRVGKSPRAGTVLRVTAPALISVLEALRPKLRKRVRVIGSANAAVHRGPLQTVSLIKIRDTARAALEAYLGERYTRVRIDVQDGEDGPIVVPQGLLELHSRTVATNPIARKVTVWTDVYVDGHQYKAVPIKFTVGAYSSVLVASVDLAAGARAASGHLVAREEQVAGLSDAPVPADANLSSLRLKRSLAVGEVLTWRHVDHLPVVARNQEIKVQLSIGAIEVETVAIALQDAKPGDVIRVRSADSQRTYPGKVTAAGTVQALWR